MYITKIENYRDSYIITLSDNSTYKADLCGYRNNYYFNFPGNRNNVLFHLLNIVKTDLQLITLGYRRDGYWPYCNTKKDCIKLLKFLMIESHKKAQKLEI